MIEDIKNVRKLSSLMEYGHKHYAPVMEPLITAAARSLCYYCEAPAQFFVEERFHSYMSELGFIVYSDSTVAWRGENDYS